MLLYPKDFQTNSIQTHEINAPGLTGIQNDNRKAKVILTAKGNLICPDLFMKSCMKIVHSVKK